METGSTRQQMNLCMRMIHKPLVNPERFLNVWQNYVYALKDTYEMNP